MSTGLVYKQVKDDIDLEILTLTSGEDAKAKNVLDKFKERLKNIEELSQPVMSRFVMDTARFFLSETVACRGAAEGTPAEGKSVEKHNQKVVGGGFFSTLVMAGATPNH